MRIGKKAVFLYLIILNIIMAQHNTIGKWGEDVAARYLAEKGYTITHRDWHPGPSPRDIDIVAITPDGTTCVFVEVKTRKDDIIMSPEDAVNYKKMKAIGLAANSFVKQYQVVLDLRFDIISIIGDGIKVKSIKQITDAFNPLLL